MTTPLNYIKSLSLSKRIIGLLLVGLLVNTWGIAYYTEHLMEEALLHEAKKQAVVFLGGIEREITANDDPLNPAVIKTAMQHAMYYRYEDSGFAVSRIFVSDAKGNVIADSEPVPKAHKDTNPEERKVFTQAQTYLGEEEEYSTDPVTGERFPNIDVIIPLFVHGVVVASIEAELDLRATTALVGRMKAKYERETLAITAISALAALTFLWWVITKRLLNPINGISRVTQEIAQGNMRVRCHTAHSGEFKKLGGAVNHMADSIQRLMDEQEQAYIETLKGLAKALEAKDSYTSSHSARVSHYSVRLAKRLGLTKKQISLLKQGAFLHDLGKIGIPDAILNKPSDLTAAEREVMRTHPTFTATILKPMRHFKEQREIAVWHHERWDGNGYPDGLKGEEIPLLARIVSIADCWDAMTGDRIYRKGIPLKEALTLLEREQDTGQWDPTLAAEFIAMIREELAGEEIIAGDRAQHSHVEPEDAFEMAS